MTPEEQQGVKAIQFLQKMSGIEEAEDVALAGWRGMPSGQRETTLRVFGIFSLGRRKEEKSE